VRKTRLRVKGVGVVRGTRGPFLHAIVRHPSARDRIVIAEQVVRSETETEQFKLLLTLRYRNFGEARNTVRGHSIPPAWNRCKLAGPDDRGSGKV
jgi:hypothetical protein